MVLGESVSLVNQPGPGAMRIEKLTAGDTITVVERDGPWFRIRGPAGRAGWAHGDDIVGLGAAIEQRLRGGGANASSGAPGG